MPLKHSTVELSALKWIGLPPLQYQELCSFCVSRTTCPWSQRMPLHTISPRYRNWWPRMVSHHRRAALQAAALLLSYSAIEIGGCLAGIYSAISPTSDASTHYVGEPVLRTGQDQIPEYQAIWIKMYERGGFEPPTPKTNSCALKRSYLSGN